MHDEFRIILRLAADELFVSMYMIQLTGPYTPRMPCSFLHTQLPYFHTMMFTYLTSYTMVKFMHIQTFSIGFSKVYGTSTLVTKRENVRRLRASIKFR